jgi:quinol-cytochrome oxidoreductase complex cytochrome b subunit
MGEYYAPKNFNLWYFFGVFSLLVLGQPVIDWNLANNELHTLR